MREDFYLKDFNEKIAETLIRRKEYDKMELERIEKLKKKLFSMKVFWPHHSKFFLYMFFRFKYFFVTFRNMTRPWLLEQISIPV